ncbi:MAG TPA: hypothetical protein VMV29_03775 [Ktedonobacterales bacterium]|nr:hypothetical protein [Ktedonobacterales bacterium]
MTTETTKSSSPQAIPDDTLGASLSRDVAPADAETLAFTATGYVIESGGPYQRLHWDATAQVLALDEIVRPTYAHGVDLVRLPLVPLAESTSAARLQRNDHRRLPSWVEEDADGLPDAQATLARLGPSLLALTLAEPSNAPGTRLQVRFLGARRIAFRNSSEMPPQKGAQESALMSSDLGDWIAITLPVADRALAAIATLDELPTPLRQRLDEALTNLMAVYPGTRLAAPVGATTIAALYQAACAHARLDRRDIEALSAQRLPHEWVFVGAQDERRLPWRESTPLGVAELLVRGAAAYAEPEQLEQWLPARFQRYVSEVLLPDERLLFFAHCPSFLARGWGGQAALVPMESDQRGASPSTKPNGWSLKGALAQARNAVGRQRGRVLQEGLLLITDRQALMLREVAPLDATLTPWGYTAQSWPLGRAIASESAPAGVALEAALDAWPVNRRQRLVGVKSFDEATIPAHWARLLVALDGLDGAEVTGVAFPPEGADALAHAASLIRRFTPWADSSATKDRRLRRIPEVEPWKPTDDEVAALETLGEVIAPAQVAALTQATTAALAPGEAILAQARTPSLDAHTSQGAALLTLTPQRLLLAQVKRQQPTSAALRAIPLGQITSATLRHSLLGCALTLALPHRPMQGEVADVSGVESLVVDFPSPLIVPFRAVFTRLRVLLGRAPCSAAR